NSSSSAVLPSPNVAELTNYSTVREQVVVDTVLVILNHLQALAERRRGRLQGTLVRNGSVSGKRFDHSLSRFLINEIPSAGLLDYRSSCVRPFGAYRVQGWCGISSKLAFRIIGPATQRVHAASAQNSRFDAIRAPSTSARSFAQATSGCTSSPAPEVPKPQSVPAMTRSRPTTPANRMMRCATNSGCSTRCTQCDTTPGTTILSSGNLMSCQTAHSCSWRGLAASTR